MEKQYLIVGNWKMNKTPAESSHLVKEILSGIAPLSSKVSAAVCPPFVNLDRCSTLLKNSPIALGAQNLYFQDNGAYTGEIAPDMLAEIGVKYVIIGHSERRTIFHETDEEIHQKIIAAQKHRLTPILCVGETLQERENGETMTVIERQITIALEGIENSNLVVAYEPIWAIGTGKTATPEIAQETHHFIRGLLSKQFSRKDMYILYGGSMKPGNARDLLAQSDISGGLLGGASLVAKDFLEIIHAAS